MGNHVGSVLSEIHDLHLQLADLLIGRQKTRPTNMMKLLLFISFLLMLSCDELKGEPSTGSISLSIGSTKILIPLRYELSGLPVSIANNDSSLDSNDSVLIEVPSRDLGISSALVNTISNTVIISISGLSDHVNSGAIDAWNGVGLFKDRVVEFDSKNKLYRIYPRSGYPIVWQYFKKAPGLEGDFLSNWVASCNAPPGTDGKDLKKVNCQTMYKYEDIESRLNLTGDKIGHLDAINDGYYKLLVMWHSD